MRARAQTPVLTRTEAACLVALRTHGTPSTRIALQARLDLARTATALKRLEELGLVGRAQASGWLPTARGSACSFATAPERPRQLSLLPSSGGQRLLDALRRPMRGCDLAATLGVTRGAVRAQLVKLCAEGRVRLGDPNNVLLIAAPLGEATRLLSAEQERVLSALPDAYATDADSIRVRARVAESRAPEILRALIADNLVAVEAGLCGGVLYRITAAGLEHPQHVRDARRAAPPPLPVKSARVRAVLSTLQAQPCRGVELSETLRVAPHSMNALMQYLKRRRLVRKTGSALHAPYSLTDDGARTLAEMTRRQAA